jgi:hypothetical protein
MIKGKVSLKRQAHSFVDKIMVEEIIPIGRCPDIGKYTALVAEDLAQPLMKKELVNIADYFCYQRKLQFQYTFLLFDTPQMFVM